jgi:hypothetical protein
VSPIFIPFISVLFLILWASSSTTIIKRYADKGHPCRTPLCNLKKPELKPLLVTQASELLYIFYTHFIIVGPKLKAVSAWYITSHRTVSNAFSKSRNAIIPFLSFNLV